MGSFALVTAGNATMATDINQYANILNGTTASAAVTLNGGTGTTMYTGYLSAAPTNSIIYYRGYVTGDTIGYRISMNIDTTANGSGGRLFFSNGTNYKGSILAENNGTGSGLWTDSHWRMQTGAQVVGGLTTDSMTASGNITVSGSAVVSGDPVCTNGSQATVCQIFTGTTTPTGANAGDIWIKA